MEQSADFLSLKSDLQQFNSHNYNEDTANRTNLENRTQAVDIINDFNLHNIPEKMRLHCFIVKHILPRLSATYKFDCEIQEDEEIRQNELKRRKMLLLEFEEEKRIKASEKARLKAKPKQVHCEQKIERLKAQASSESVSGYTSCSSSSSSGSGSLSMDSRNMTLQFREFVQGTAAKELFLHLDRICPLKVRKEAIEYVKSAASDDERYMLSDLLKEIDEHNKSEIPYFKEPPTVEDEANSVAVNLKSVPAKDGVCRTETKSSKVHLVPEHKGKWTTDGIYVQKYDDELKTIVLRTTDLGEIFVLK